MVKLTFNGAAHTVTGSCYLLETKDSKILIDCGMFQGLDVEDLNKSFNFDPRTLDVVLLTHAHIDHSGLIPKLYKEGFNGKVYSTSESHELSEILLYDSAKIQENNVLRPRNGGSGAKPMSLYDTLNVDEYVRSMEVVKMGEWNTLRDFKFKYIRAGHILGAASILIESEGKIILFSGDLGRREQSLILPYEYIDEEVDYVVMESLYGGNFHDKREVSIQNLEKIIEDTTRRDGNVMIPSFSVHRSQELVAYLYKSLQGSRISKNVQIILDGPLTIAATDIYTKYIDAYTDEDASKSEYIYSGEEFSDIFSMQNLLVIKDSFVSKRATRKRKAVIIAGNGMVQGGRILGHLFKGIRNAKNSVVFVGFQAEGTLGRKIVEGEKFVKINGKNLKVEAQIHDLKGLSAHADHSDLLDWFENKKSERLKKVFLVHAEPERSEAFKAAIQSDAYETLIPNIKDSFEL